MADLETLSRQVSDLTLLVERMAKRLPTIVSIDEAARIFDVSPRTVRRRIKDREWPHVMVGKHVRIDLSKVRP